MKGSMYKLLCLDPSFMPLNKLQKKPIHFRYIWLSHRHRGMDYQQARDRRELTARMRG